MYIPFSLREKHVYTEHLKRLQFHKEQIHQISKRKKHYKNYKRKGIYSKRN